jgi:Ser/Thr protein kinase RdoA (MazF antagonist)
MSLVNIKTIGRHFQFDLNDLTELISQQYDFGSIDTIKLLGKGNVNLNFIAKSRTGQKIVIRTFGEYDEHTQIELDTMLKLADSGFTTPRPFPSSSKSLIEKFEDIHIAVLEYIAGDIPNYSPKTFERIGEKIADFQNTIENIDLKLTNENRYLKTYKRKTELIELVKKEDKLLKKILNEQVYSTINEQISLFEEIEFTTTDYSPIHSDIYNLNMLDNGNDIYLLDFEYIGLGPQIIDTISYIGFDGIVNDRTERKYADIYSGEAVLLEQHVERYLKGFKKNRGIADLTDLVAGFMMINIGDNFYNLEKAIKAGENLFGGYIRHYNNAKEIMKKKDLLKTMI